MNYTIIFVPFIAMVFTQAFKNILDSFRGKFSWSNLNSYGGMPSAHSALVGALATKMGMTYGLASPYFALAAVYAFLTIRDAVGLRRALGYHAKILNRLITELPDAREIEYPHLEERLGHTYTQAAIGCAIGILFGLLF